MSRLQSKSLGAPDEVRSMPNGKVEIYNLDEIVWGRTTFEPGWRWSKDVKPIAGTETCQYHHVSFAVSGRMHAEMADGTAIEVGPGSLFEIPPGHDAWVIGDEPFVSIDAAGMRSFARVDEGSQRILCSILFTDIVDSTGMAERLGPTRWNELLRNHQQDVQFQLDRFRGRLVKSTGDGFLASFDGSERAIRAARGIVVAAAERGLQVRAGVHTGEVEQVAGDLQGLSVHLAARVMAAAPPGGVYVSATTAELVSGTAIELEDAGVHELKGITGARQLFALRTA